MSLQATTWQTVGPYFHIGLARLYQADVAGEDVRGQRIQVRCRVLDGDQLPIPDAVVEIWQANADGKYAHPDDSQVKPLEPGFRGYGRIPTDENGFLQFSTIKPGAVPGPDGKPQAPHLLVSLMMRGLLKRLVTRIYFPGEPLNATDPILQLVDPERRATLMLNPVPDQPGVFAWEIHMQGDNETVFFEI
jgi:protocatechuate 3,4-dioxygenase alpha subunit